MQAILTENVKKKWEKVLDESHNATKIENATVRNNMIRMLENTSRELNLSEATTTGDVAGYDPLLINLIRRTQPSLMGNQLVGVQPMDRPTGLVFAMRNYYGAKQNTETWNANRPDDTQSGPYATADGEVLGTDTHVAGGATDPVNDPVLQTNPWTEMSFDIQKITVTAKTRAMKAKYTHELEQDLRAIHGADAEKELSDILSGEIVAEIDQEILAKIRQQATVAAKTTESFGGAAFGADGVFDLDVNSDGRWAVEKYKMLLVYIDTQANRIARETRRGRGNWLIVSADLAGALDMAGRLDTSFTPGSTPADPVGLNFVGILGGKYRVFIDPYQTANEVIVGYKGANVYDAGIFYCPYVPLQMYKGEGEEDFQPRIGFKTRYGIAVNPYSDQGSANVNPYYRKFTVANL